ncbi:15986_t:CDS:1 [Funneliformis mosseae]|uniref:15986_t:CDS:1 n=1 Tax=Funneliformis mosseae TaxID=27381 RepID=A0A9N9A024_FUNMO|nr:15986_t:CDS:1 [Funneliformis mosseae]
MNRERDKEIVKKAAVRGKIKSVDYVTTENNKNYAIVINKVASLYAIRVINYDEDENEIKIKAVKRFPDLMGFYRTKELANEELEKIKSNSELINQCQYEIETQEDDVENILLIGRTGGGKSTLANVISNTDEFGESGSSVSKTKRFQTKDFTWNGTKYRIVDTIGVGDTKNSEEEVLYMIGEAVHSMKKGIKQVFVIIGGRFTKEEVETFDLLKKAIFESGITKYTTIVRTRFEDFENPEECNKDKENLKNENKKIFKLVDSCNDIVYVNNPPLSKRRLEDNKKDRENSRKILLKYLNYCGDNYKVDNWDNICVRVNDFMNVKNLKVKEYEDIANASSLNVITENRIKREIKEMEKRVIEEVKEVRNQSRETEVRARVKIPLFADIELLTNVKGGCCSII